MNTNKFKVKQSEVVIRRATTSDIDKIVDIYKQVSLTENLKEKLDKDSDLCFSKVGGAIKLPDPILLKRVILADDFTFNLAEHQNNVIGFIWGSYTCNLTDPLLKTFNNCGTRTEEYVKFERKLTNNQVSYGGDLMIHPGHQRSYIGLILLHLYYTELLSIRKTQVLFMIEHIISLCVNDFHYETELYNEASLRFHHNLGAKKVKEVTETIELSSNDKVVRLSSFYIENLEEANESILSILMKKNIRRV